MTALELLRTQTGGTFDFWSLTGPHRLHARRMLAIALGNGTKPLVGAIREKFYKNAGISTSLCEAARQSAFVEWANNGGRVFIGVDWGFGEDILSPPSLLKHPDETDREFAIRCGYGRGIPR